ncbi:hypothetical protein DL93DRAFT_2096710 [Clavulina sp. PMI_390]|nr:hypothetical protein DL93DRAFT_2096710 [Clavulina sp. PMI_390]
MARISLVVIASLAAIFPVFADLNFRGKRMTINTALNFTTVDSNVASLVGYANYQGCTTYGPAQGNVNEAIKTGNLTLFENAIESITGPADFMVFNMLYYTTFMPVFVPGSIAQAKTYIIGNPVVAATMVQYDTVAGLHVPTRIVVNELFDSKNQSIGTSVVWDVPSTLIATGHLPPTTEKKLRAAARVLDSILENMVRNATGVGRY